MKDEILCVHKSFRKVQVSNKHCKGVGFEVEFMGWNTFVDGSDY